MRPHTLAATVGIVLCLGAASAQDQAGQPSADQFRKASIDWDSAQLMEVFHAKHADASKDELARVQTFVHRALEYVQWEEGVPTLGQLQNEENDLEAGNLADSMVHALGGYVIAQRPEAAYLAEAGRRLEQHVPQMEKDGYPAHFLATLHFTRARCAFQQPDAVTMTSAILASAVQSVSHALRDRDWSADEERFLHWRLSWSINDRFMLRASGQAMVGLLQAPGGKNAWLSEMLMGEWEITEAWMDRGNGWAKDVSNEGWQGFTQHIAAARTHLLKAYTLRPEYPEAASRMIAVAMAGGVPDGESARLWFERARDAQFDYDAAYEAYLHSIRASWGGSNDDVLAFSVECAATERYDTPVPLVSFSAVRAAAEDSKAPTGVWAASYESLQEVLTGYLALGDAANVHRSLTRMVLLAYLADRPKDAREALDRIGGPENLATDIVRDFRLGQETLGARIYAATNPGTPKLTLASAALKEARWDDAVSNARTAVELSAAEPPRSLQVVRHRAAMIMQLTDFGRGMPVAPRFEPSLPGWLAYYGKWSPLGTTGVEAKDKGCLLTGARFGRQYEVSAEISTTPDPMGDAAAGFRIDPRGRGNPCDIMLTQDGDDRRLVITGINGREVVLTSRTPVNSLTVQVWNETCVVKVNGQAVYKGVLAFEPNRDQDGDMIALSSLGPAKFTNVRIRKLAAPPLGSGVAHIKNMVPTKGTVISGKSAGRSGGGLSPFRRF